MNRQLRHILVVALIMLAALLVFTAVPAVLLLVVGGLRLGYEALYVLVGPNIHVVVPGKVHRADTRTRTLVPAMLSMFVA